MAKTNIRGFLNNNEYPLQLQISKFNQTIQVAAGEYVRDANGRLINDSILAGYVGPGMLVCEQIAKGQPPVDLVAIHPSESGNPVSGTQIVKRDEQQAAHPVSTADRLQKDGRGNVVPVNLKTVAAHGGPVPAGYNPIVGLSVEEARKAGLIGKPRLVPEDYGADVGGGGGQPIPPIRVSMESNRPVGQLPRDYQQEAQAEADQTVRQLEAASRLDAEVENPLGWINPGNTIPAQPPSAPAPSAPVTAPPSIPLPVDLNVPTATVETETTPPEAVEEHEPGEVPASPGKPYHCPFDGANFQYRSQLKRHLERKFPDRVEQVLQNYPITEMGARASRRAEVKAPATATALPEPNV